MTQIRTLVSSTAVDLRGGRQSWRVFSLLWLSALAVTVAVELLLR
jgi:hypothetical protein